MATAKGTHVPREGYYTAAEVIALLGKVPSQKDIDKALSDYYTEDQIDEIVADGLAGKSDVDHTHDDRYYTQTEINDMLSVQHVVSLWTNSDTTSSFAAQTVPLSDSVTNYDFLLVTYAFSTGSQDYSSTLIPVSEIYTNAVQYNLNINAGANNRTGNRKINVPTATTVSFGTGAYDGSANKDGNVIPAAIYGIKL